MTLPCDRVFLEKAQALCEAVLLPGVEQRHRLLHGRGEYESRNVVRTHPLELRALPAVLVVIAGERESIGRLRIHAVFPGEVLVERG